MNGSSKALKSQISKILLLTIITIGSLSLQTGCGVKADPQPAYPEPFFEPLVDEDLVVISSSSKESEQKKDSKKKESP